MSATPDERISRLEQVMITVADLATTSANRLDQGEARLDKHEERMARLDEIVVAQQGALRGIQETLGLITHRQEQQTALLQKLVDLLSQRNGQP